MQVVWFKRDLRVQDHAALLQAAQCGPVLPLYIFEPALWQQPDMSPRQYDFLIDCLKELHRALRELGQGLVVKVGTATQVLQDLHQRHQIKALWSHQETWNGWTYDRDKDVLEWCRTHNIPWHEPLQHGVIRRLETRDGWAARWYALMNQPLVPTPQHLPAIKEASDKLPLTQDLRLASLPCPQRQVGGRRQALDLLDSFLHTRGEGYTKDMSSPVTAFQACSRLSPHLAFGSLSVREAFQAAEQRHQQIKAMPRAMQGKWPSALSSFTGRLRWHCHFIQKLEDEPRLEFDNLHPAYDGLRDFHAATFQAWQNGMTGYPMVDACMRALTATGWLNFRMRAMVMSFSSYHLWLEWRQPTLHLARLFTDYEPGIHYSQVQMQSGTTGMNAIRIYNPIKQGIDQDPHGEFIRTWIPELRDMEQAYIHTPWRAESQMNGYPLPIVDEQAARKAAASRLYALRRDNPEHREKTVQLLQKHGSRKSRPRTRKNAVATASKRQGELPL